jgi:repressor LexA
MLTHKQRELLMFIHERLRESGVPPSFDEMKLALDLKSKSGIHRLITALEERGFLKRMPHRARALEVVKLPDNVQIPQPRPRSVPAVGHGRAPMGLVSSQAAFRPPSPQVAISRSGGSNRKVVDIPIMGRIAAGTPIEAIQTAQDHVSIPESMLGSGEIFALEVNGDSMIQAGILDGDTVLIQRTPDATSGDIVVALVDNSEATLKRLRKRGDSIALEAANPAYETRIFGTDRVKVQGKLVGLLRRY